MTEITLFLFNYIFLRKPKNPREKQPFPAGVDAHEKARITTEFGRRRHIYYKGYFTFENRFVRLTTSPLHTKSEKNKNFFK